MNYSRNYNDELEGDFLACKPGNVAEGLEGICTLGMPIIGWGTLLNSFWFLYLAYIQRCHRKLLAKQTWDPACVPKVRNSPKVYPQSDATDTFSYMEKLLLCLGVATASFSPMFLLHGAGTMYSTTHIRGQIGDVAGTKERNSNGLV